MSYNKRTDAELGKAPKAILVKIKKQGISPEQFFARTIRRAIDQILDGANNQRWRYDQLSDKPEKTFVGTKIEVLTQRVLELTKGSDTDYSISGVGVDMKTTKNGFAWQIPANAVKDQHLCLVLKYQDEHSRTFSIGLVRAREDILNPGSNQDKKRTISLEGRKHILWLVENVELPMNPLAQMEQANREQFEMLLDQHLPTADRVSIWLGFAKSSQIIWHRDVFETVGIPLECALDAMQDLREQGMEILCGRRL